MTSPPRSAGAASGISPAAAAAMVRGDDRIWISTRMAPPGRRFADTRAGARGVSSGYLAVAAAVWTAVRRGVGPLMAHSTTSGGAVTRGRRNAGPGSVDGEPWARHRQDDGCNVGAVSGADDLACQEVVEVITLYLEGAMSPADRARFERHLEECPACVVYVEQMRATIAALGRLSPERIRPEARRDLVLAFRHWRDDAGAAG
jgi:Putative zinc-finger